MNDMFPHMHLAPEFVCEFLAVFSRLEYALKAARYLAADNGDARANWDEFANSISCGFERIEDDTFREAVNYLSEQPPRKQVVREGTLGFEERAQDDRRARSQQVLLSVRTVRNNLFHGGKFLVEREVDRGRDELLVRHSLTVLRHCAELDLEVGTHYRQ
jgi:hypothetical protein